MEGEEHFFDAESPKKINYFGYRSVRFRNQGIVISDFRFKTFTTWFVIPWDAEYKSFETRAKSALDEARKYFGFELEKININDCIVSNHLYLKRVIPRSIVKKMMHKT